MKQYTHLSLEERSKIYELLQLWKTQEAIAENLGRNPGTISREIARNHSLISKSLNGAKWSRKEEDYHYLPDTAERKYHERQKFKNYRPPLKNPRVFSYVVQKLAEELWSPDGIAGALLLVYPDEPSMRVSHECIYQFIYSKLWEELGLKRFLLRSHKKRKKKTGRSVRKTSKIPNRIDILLRPKEVEAREVFGHFEGDSILSERPSKSALRTEVERMSRKIFLRKIPRKTAEFTKIAALQIYSEFTPGIVKSITYDNGSEHSKHEEITKILGIPIYFAHPYHSWERGTNEHANGMIRRFFPKGTNFDEISDEQLQKVVDYLNNRPRKILWYKTSNQIFEEELQKYKESNPSTELF